MLLFWYLYFSILELEYRELKHYRENASTFTVLTFVGVKRLDSSTAPWETCQGPPSLSLLSCSLSWSWRLVHELHQSWYLFGLGSSFPWESLLRIFLLYPPQECLRLPCLWRHKCSSPSPKTYMDLSGCQLSSGLLLSSPLWLYCPWRLKFHRCSLFIIILSIANYNFNLKIVF